VTIRNPLATTVSIPSGSQFQLYDDDDFNNDDGPMGDGTLDGDTGEDIPEPNTSLLQSDDTPCSSIIVSGCNVLASAYVRPVYDITSDIRDNRIFLANIDTSTTNNVRAAFVDFDQLPTEDDPEFWTIYLYGAYQGGISQDADPADEDGDGNPDGCPDASYGVTDTLGPNAWGSCIFMEVSRPREYPVDYASRPVSRAWTTVHEVGHIFGGDHPDGGIMTPSCTRTGYEFAPVTIRRLRHEIMHP
jgi:hypothetical protein